MTLFLLLVDVREVLLEWNYQEAIDRTPNPHEYLVIINPDSILSESL